MKKKFLKALDPRYGRRIWIVHDTNKIYVMIPSEKKVSIRGKQVKLRVRDIPKFTPKLLAC